VDKHALLVRMNPKYWPAWESKIKSGQESHVWFEIGRRIPEEIQAGVPVVVLGTSGMGILATGETASAAEIRGDPDWAEAAPSEQAECKEPRNRVRIRMQGLAAPVPIEDIEANPGIARLPNVAREAINWLKSDGYDALMSLVQVSSTLNRKTTSNLAMDHRIYAPAAGLETWKARLAEPDTQWVRRKSAFETAVFWELGARQPRGLHTRVAALLDREELLRDCELIASFPEHRVRLPGGSRASQTDVWAMLRGPRGPISLAVEGKAGESFAETIGDWRREASGGKEKRLAFLCEQLGLPQGVNDTIRYQLVHRTASALIEAERIGAVAAVMLVLSFTPDAVSKGDYDAFVSCLGGKATLDRLATAASSAKRPLFLGWLDLPPCTDADIAAIAV